MLRFVTAWGHQLSKKSLFLAQSAHHQSFTDRPVGRLDSEAAPKGNGISRWSSQAPKVASKYLFPLEMFTSWAAKKKKHDIIFFVQAKLQICQKYMEKIWQSSSKFVSSKNVSQIFLLLNSCFVSTTRWGSAPSIAPVHKACWAEPKPEKKKHEDLWHNMCFLIYIYIYIIRLWYSQIWYIMIYYDISYIYVYSMYVVDCIFGSCDLLRSRVVAYICKLKHSAGACLQRAVFTYIPYCINLSIEFNRHPT